MAATAAHQAAREAKMRAEIEAEVRAEFEAKMAQQAKDAASATATSVSALAKDPDPQSDELTDGSVTVHFVMDGLTLLGNVWMAGEELTVSPGSRNWEALVDTELDMMVLNLTPLQQKKRYKGKHFFSPGPYPFKVEELDEDTLSPEDREILRTIQRKKAMTA